MIAICDPEFMYALCRMSSTNWSTDRRWLALNDQMSRLRNNPTWDEAWQEVKQIHGEMRTRRRK